MFDSILECGLLATMVGVTLQVTPWSHRAVIGYVHVHQPSLGPRTKHNRQHTSKI